MRFNADTFMMGFVILIMTALGLIMFMGAIALMGWWVILAPPAISLFYVAACAIGTFMENHDWDF